MAEQIRVEELITNMMFRFSNIIEDRDTLRNTQDILFMELSCLQIYREETALSTVVDSTEEWVKTYLASMLIRGCTEKTIAAYQFQYRMFFQTVNKSAADVTTGDIRQYLAHCKLVRKNRDTTINNKKRMLRSLFTWLTEEEYIEKNPMVRIKDSKVEHRVKDVFEDEHITIIKDVAMKHSLRAIAIVDFLHRTGVRISEMVALDRKDIDFVGRQCIVYGKGRKERPVYFSGDAAVHLKEYLDSRTDDNPALFVCHKCPNRRMSADAVRLELNRLRDMDPRLHGLEVNPHKWRRQFVTELLEKDVPLTLVADLVGHANLNTTKSNYGNYSRSKAREAHRKYVS